MSAIQEIFRRYAPEYLARYGEAMPASHKKAIEAIVHCRDGLFGTHVYRCDACGEEHHVPCSCGNRHCPSCQHRKATEWLYKQMGKLLPCPYFMITFTLPEELRAFVRSHQREGYSAMFSAASEAMKKLARDDRFVGADQIGAVGVLQTWGRQLNYHPHIHFIVPGGGLSKDRGEWVPSKPSFFIRVEPLSIVYRAKFRDAMAKAGLLEQIDPTVWKKPWVVNSQAVGDGRSSLEYLAPYVFRVAMSNDRIVSYDDHEVTFLYPKDKSSRPRRMTLDAMEFIRRFLQHVLPARFMKIRHYGFLGANAGTPLERIREFICLLYEVVRDFVEPLLPPSLPPLRCPVCGKPLRWQAFMPPSFIPTG